jgi:hypothetical protein
MTKQNQIVAIAESMGYVWMEFTREDKTTFIYFLLTKNLSDFGERFNGKIIQRPIDYGDEWKNAPDYLNDLNEMHKVEQTMQHYGFYFDKLADVMKVNRGSLCLIFATAAQRAEAYLKTLLLWKN